MNLTRRTTRRPPTTHRTIRPRAFSLVELAIVLAVLAVTAAVAAPRYAHSVQRYRLDAAAKRIAADLEYTGAFAKASSAQQKVNFDILGCGYASTAAPPTTQRHLASLNVSLAAEPYRVALISANFGGTEGATFSGFGTPTVGGSVLIGAGKEGRRIMLDAVTGRATITPEGIP